jgi:RNA 2',3'-cyclic 3'-phosphodiesterase
MSRGATARLFVAADPPAPVRERLAGWAREAAAAVQSPGAPRPLRLLDPDNLHLTLCFLGSRPVEEIEAIGATLSAYAADVGELSVGAPLWLPRARPRSLAVAIHDEGGELTGLQAAVTAAISETSGWEPERRRFRAHVTVARTRGRAPRGLRAPSRAGDGACLPATPQLRFSAESLTLYRSWLSPAGAAYEAVAMCELSPSVS